MSKECAVMTINDRESSKSPTGNHSIDDILGIKATAGAHLPTNNSHNHLHEVQQMYSNSGTGSDSSSDSSASERENTPSPAPVAAAAQEISGCSSPNAIARQQMLQIASVGGSQQQFQHHHPGMSLQLWVNVLYTLIEILFAFHLQNKLFFK